jgi:hypothetical protein
MKFANLRDGTEITFKPTSTKLSRELNKEFVKFSKEIGDKKDAAVVDFSGEEVAAFLSSLTSKILVANYGFTPDSVSELDDVTTVTELCDFLSGQIEVNGPTDFLIKPLGALIKGMEQFSKSLDTAITAEIVKVTTNTT